MSDELDRKTSALLMDCDTHARPSGPDATAMSSTWCAQKVANLEGWRHLNTAKLLLGKVTVENIDRRTRHLETLFEAESPPPMLAVTWESLEWRILRLDRRASQGMLLLGDCVREPQHELAAPASHADALATIKTVLATYWRDDAGVGCSALPDDAAAADHTALAQCLSWAAGRMHFRSPDRQHDVAQLYRFALELALAVPAPDRTRPPVPRSIPPDPRLVRPRGFPPRPGPPGMVLPPRAAMVGGCNCYCHGPPPGPPPPPPPPHRPPPRAMDVEPPRRKSKPAGFLGWGRRGKAKKTGKGPRFGWFRALWCFGGGTKVEDSDDESGNATDSDTSSAASTIVDD